MTTSVPLLLYGGALLTDMPVYFLITVALYLVGEWNQTSVKRLMFAGLLTGIGILTKESVGMLVLFALLSLITLKANNSKVIQFLVSAVPAPIISWVLSAWNPVTYISTSYAPSLSYSQRFGLSGLRPFKVLISTFYAFNVAFPLAVLGLIRERDEQKFKWYISFIVPAAFLSLAFTLSDARYLFTLSPAIFPLASLSIA